MPEDLGPMAPFERGRSRKIYTVYRFKNWDGRRGSMGGREVKKRRGGALYPIWG